VVIARSTIDLHVFGLSGLTWPGRPYSVVVTVALGTGGPIAQAAVELVADGSEFTANAQKAVVAAGQVATSTGAQHGQSYGTGFHSRVKNVAECEGIRDAVQFEFAAVASGIKDVISIGVEASRTRRCMRRAGRARCGRRGAISSGDTGVWAAARCPNWTDNGQPQRHQ
jgi:hypothetical protein